MMKYNLQKRWLAAFAFAFIGLCASAQSQIKGHVYDSAGEPLIGAYVTVEGTKDGSITDIPLPIPLISRSTLKRLPSGSTTALSPLIPLEHFLRSPKLLSNFTNESEGT